MDAHGAFPGWLNRLWWMLFPGAVFGALVDIGSAISIVEQKATGLGAVGGLGVDFPGGMYLDALWTSYLLTALALIHPWFLIALGFAIRKRASLGRWEKWKLGGAALALAAIWSPFIVLATLVLVGSLAR